MRRRTWLPVAVGALLLAFFLAGDGPLDAASPARDRCDSRGQARGPRCTPTAVRTMTPTAMPTTAPTAVPTHAHTPVPTIVPTVAPTVAPTVTVTAVPTVVSTTVPTVSPTATAVSTVVPGATSVLLDKYELLRPNGPDYGLTAYKPRQHVNGVVIQDASWGPYTISDVGPYAGWDLFLTPNVSVNRIATEDWFTLTLNRPARLAVVLQDNGPGPTWLASWTPGPRVGFSDGSTSPTFTKDVPAGTVTMGGASRAGELVNAYWMLLAEQGGVPSAAPMVPAGQPVPQPNQTCPSWVHDRYTTTVDGTAWPTWHRQIDPQYWCYFRHEHGSDPKLFGDGTWTPAYGRSAAAMPMPENHEGFKGALFENNGYAWYIELHFGTSNPVGGACIRHHEVGVALARLGDKRLMADVQFMGDYGRAVENISQQNLVPDACPTQADGIPTNAGNKSHPVDGPGLVMYYPWRLGDYGPALGLMGTFAMNTPDAIAICGNLRCNPVIPAGDPGHPNKGARRFVNMTSDFALTAALAARTGVFYTDAHGGSVLSGPGPSAVRQRVEAGTDAHFAFLGEITGCRTGAGLWNLFENKYICQGDSGQGNSQELESSLRSPN